MQQTDQPFAVLSSAGLGLVPKRESAGMTYRWLVENFTPEGQSTGLYMACQVNMTLTADVNAARKFRRQRTAEFRALDMREARRGDWRAVEHGFDDSKTPNEKGNRLAEGKSELTGLLGGPSRSEKE